LEEEIKEEKVLNKNFEKSITYKIFVWCENLGLWLLKVLHLKFLASFYENHIEAMRYLVCGALSTLVNILSYALGARIIFTFLDNKSAIVNVSEIFAFVVALIFAYWVNKIIVFDSKCSSTKELLKEIVSFVLR